jgi:hypothetical protein
MTWGGGKPHQVGDRGQRYEVSVMDAEKNERIIVGWVNDKSAAERWAVAACLRPSWYHGQVRDRKP